MDWSASNRSSTDKILRKFADSFIRIVKTSDPVTFLRIIRSTFDSEMAW